MKSLCLVILVNYFQKFKTLQTQNKTKKKNYRKQNRLQLEIDYLHHVFWGRPLTIQQHLFQRLLHNWNLLSILLKYLLLNLIVVVEMKMWSRVAIFRDWVCVPKRKFKIFGLVKFQKHTIWSLLTFIKLAKHSAMWSNNCVPDPNIILCGMA